MENFSFNGTYIIRGVILLVLFYAIIMMLIYVLEHTSWLGNYRTKLAGRLKKSLHIIEPISFLLGICIFISFNPMVNGFITAIFLVFAYFPIRNYFIGRMLILSNQLSIGQHMTTEKEDGILKEIGRLGLTVQTDEGNAFINYHQLLQQGYTTRQDTPNGSFIQLNIQGDKEGDALAQNIKDKLFDCPYLDEMYQPEIRKDHASPSIVKVKILLKQDKYRNHFLDLLKEWNYEYHIL